MNDLENRLAEVRKQQIDACFFRTDKEKAERLRGFDACARAMREFSRETFEKLQARINQLETAIAQEAKETLGKYREQDSNKKRR